MIYNKVQQSLRSDVKTANVHGVNQRPFLADTVEKLPF